MLDANPFGTLRARSVLSRTLRVYGQHFGTLVTIVAVTMAPLTALQVLLSRRLITSPMPVGDELSSGAAAVGCLSIALIVPVGLASYSLAAGAVACAVNDEYLGREVSIGRSFGYARRRFGALFGMSLSIGIRVLLGFLLVVIPGLVSACAYAIAIPVLITEGAEPEQAMQRSRLLARGQKWKIFRVFLALAVVGTLLEVLLAVFAGWKLDVESAYGVTIFQLAFGLLGALMAPLQLVAMTLLYYDARIHSEDFDVDTLSREFSAGSPRPRPGASHQLRAAIPPAERMVRARQKDVDGGDYAARMSWRSVTYILGGRAIHFQIEPMTVSPDIVFIPDEQVWQQSAPDWAREHRALIVSCLQALRWNRILEWRDSPSHDLWYTAAGETRVVDGTVEATRGGQILESQGLFHPDQRATPLEVRDVWHETVRKHAARAGGRVSVDLDKVVANSVFEEIELPGLRRNPRVDLDLRSLAAVPSKVDVASAGAPAVATVERRPESAQPPAPGVTGSPPEESVPIGSPAAAPARLTASDVFVALDAETRGSLLDDWRWLVGESARVFRVTVFGDVFVTTPDGSIHTLDTGRGTYEKVAENAAEWERLLPVSASAWFHVELLRELHAMNLRLARGQVYGWLEPQMLGGQETVENVYAISAHSHISEMAKIARQRIDPAVTDGP